MCGAEGWAGHLTIVCGTHYWVLINPAFADALGWPPLADGNGPVMLSIAAGTVLVTAWEIFDGFRRARRADTAMAGIGEPGKAL